MSIYLVQHAQSKSKEEDPERGLTDEGKETAKKAAEFFSGLELNIDEIWHSGKKRAKQTAELFAVKIKRQNAISVHENLGPTDDIEPVKREIEKGDKGDVMIVGHLPFLSRLTSALITGNPDRDIITFRNAAINCLEKDEEGWKVSWIVTPDIIR